MTYANPETALPATIEYEMQPYGCETLGELRWGKCNGFPTISGKVIAGTSTSRIGAHRSTRSTVGEPRTIYGVHQNEIENRRCVRIAA